MAKKKPRALLNYHKAFLAACVLLLATTIWVFVDDYANREYPGWQDRYEQLELKRLSRDRALVEEELQALNEQQKALEAALAQARAARAEHAYEIWYAKRELRRIDGILGGLKRQLNFANADVGVYRYRASYGLAAEPQYEEELAHQRATFNQLEKLKAERAEQRKLIAQYEGPVKAAQKALDTHLAKKNSLARSYAKLKGLPLLNVIRDLPGFDFIQPRHNLNDQIQLRNLPVDRKFGAISMRVDRCVVCHKAIDNPDPQYRDPKLPTVMRSHPRLSLFAGSNSPHPMIKFGCTVCHRGRPMGTSFLRAAHTPQNKAQEQRWRKAYGWDTMDHHKPGLPLWDDPMLPLPYTEASCVKCHHGVDTIPGAETLNKGRDLFREKGCVNCHIGNNDPDYAWMGRVGPDLRRLGEKVRKNWARKWIENPWHFRPTTRMPRFFGLENRKDDVVTTKDGAKRPRDRVEVEAIATYLFAASKLRERPLPKAPPGDAARGKRLFSLVGCLGCHSTADAKDAFTFNNHGPDLSRIGDKTNSAWLYAWLKNPHDYWAETRMPSLRLSNQEAADLTAYLMRTMKTHGPNGGKKLARAPESALDALIWDLKKKRAANVTIEKALQNPGRLVRELLKKKVAYARKPGAKEPYDTGRGEWTEAQIGAVMKILDAMGGGKAGRARAKKAFYVGQRMIQHYGCFACHSIQGWTYAPIPCVNLVGEADKEVRRLAFGNTRIPRTNWDWFYLKLARPRVFDMGTAKPNVAVRKLDVTEPLERLKMPWFGFERGTVPQERAAHAEAEEGAHGSPGLTATGGKDQSSGHGLTHQDVQALVTVLLSLTKEAIPKDMRKLPTPRDLAMDRGARVIRTLNCTGCHQTGVHPAQLNAAATPLGRIPLEALLTREAQRAAKKLGIYSDQDLFRLDEPNSGARDFLNFQRGTYLTESTLPILLAELPVRRSPLDPWRPIGFELLSKRKVRRIKGPEKARFVPYQQLVDLPLFQRLTQGLFANEKEAEAAYRKNAGRYVNLDAYERLAGSAAFHRPHLKRAPFYKSSLALDRLKQQKRFYQPVYVRARWMKGEGRIVPHIIAVLKSIRADASRQDAPPSLAFEGGKVQPDWFYRFLRHVRPIRPGLKIRMPSFWAPGAFRAYKKVYPAGRLSVLDPNLRPLGTGGETAPPSGSRRSVPDDAQQVVAYFSVRAGEKPYGFQPLTALDAGSRKQYARGFRLLLAPGQGGLGCVKCHRIGALHPPKPIAPDLALAKQRLKPGWLRRFLTSPGSLYPWTKMPSNFFDWTNYRYRPKDPRRALKDEQRFNEITKQLQAAYFYLRHAGEAEIGTRAPPETADRKPGSNRR